ncbi:Adenylate cyclase [Caballeronia sordidicola]|uniref:Adenylate cyclase n=1 Tax=Caballeronia sordidicola TaxID=196367 RepID=A0A226X3H9_CABSO|nr:Adenylate cyclase [Caballeronia sordidicola]
MPVSADRRSILQGQRCISRRSPRRLQPAGSAQGLHRRCLSDPGSPRDGRRLHPPDRRRAPALANA